VGNQAGLVLYRYVTDGRGKDEELSVGTTISKQGQWIVAKHI